MARLQGALSYGTVPQAERMQGAPSQAYPGRRTDKA